MALWDGLVPESDLRMYGKGGYGTTFGAGNKPAVIVVDMTLAFVDEHFGQGSPTGPPAAKNIRRLLEVARSKKAPVIYSVGTGGKKPAERGRWQAGGIPPEANEIWPEVAPESEDIVIAKRKPSVFFGTDLASVLNFYNVDTTIITGMTTSGCVRATVLDAFSYNYYVIVPEECVADRADTPHRLNLFDIHMKYGDVLPLSQVESYLRGLP